MLARRHLLREECAYDTSNMSSNGGVNSKETEDGTKGTSLVNLFAAFDDVFMSFSGRFDRLEGLLVCSVLHSGV